MVNVTTKALVFSLAGFVLSIAAANAWDRAIHDSIKHYFGGDLQVEYMYAYAIGVTLVAMAALYYAIRIGDPLLQ
jgi:hypothetical protein